MTITEATTPAVGTKSGITPYVAMAGQAAAACDFYVRAFGASEVGRIPFPDGQPGLMHAQLEINGGHLCMTDSAMMNDANGAPFSGRFGHLQLEVADGRSWWERAVAAGCIVRAAYQRQPWGDDWGLLEDPFGLRWAILQTGS
jgi:PhnB protein